MEFTLTFLKTFFLALQLTMPTWMLMILLIVGLGQIAGRFEGWSPRSALYWSFVTASTVGYGDMSPRSSGGRVLAIFIALFGLILYGIIVAIAVQATTYAVRLHGTLP